MTWSLPVLTCPQCNTGLSVGQGPPIVCHECGHEESMLPDMWQSFADIEHELNRIEDEALRALKGSALARYRAGAGVEAARESALQAAREAAAAGRFIDCPYCWAPNLAAPNVPSFVDCDECEGELRGALGLIIENDDDLNERTKRWMAAASAFLDEVGPEVDDSGTPAPPPTQAGPNQGAAMAAPEPPAPAPPPADAAPAAPPAQPGAQPAQNMAPMAPKAAEAAEAAAKPAKTDKAPSAMAGKLADLGTNMALLAGAVVLAFSGVAIVGGVMILGSDMVPTSEPQVEAVGVTEEAPVSFADIKRYPLQPDDKPAHLAVGDLDGDGNVDVVTSIKGGIAIFNNAGGGKLRSPQMLRSGGEFFTFGDLDNDTDNDIVAAGPGRIVIYRNAGGGQFRLPEIHSAAGQGLTDLTLVDVDTDGRLDIVTVGRGGLTMILNSGKRSLGKSNTVRLGDGSTAVDSGDVNGDGVPDLAVVGTDGMLYLLINQGKGTFEAKPVEVGGTLSDVALWDLDKDQRADVVIASRHGVRVVINPLEPKVSKHAVCTAASVSVADLQGPNSRDIVVTCPDASQVAVLFNSGKGTFELGGQYKMPGKPKDARGADLDGDGKAELVVASPGQHAVLVLSPQ